MIMDWNIPPGPKFLFSHYHVFVFPPLAAYILLWVLSSTLSYKIHGVVRVILPLLAIPVFCLARIQANEWHRSIKARRSGGRLPKLIPHKWPGGIDLLLDMQRKQKTIYPGETMARFYAQHGQWTLSSKMMFNTIINTAEPEHIKSILATDFGNFEKGPVTFAILRSMLGSGVFNSDGDMWKFHRTMTRPFFTKDRISHFDIFNRHAEDAISQMKTRLKEGYAVDLQDLVSRFTLDSATDFLFGTDVCSLASGLPYPADKQPITGLSLTSSNAGSDFAATFTDAQTTTLTRLRFGPVWPLFEFWRDKPAHRMKSLDHVIDPIVRYAIEKQKSTAGQKDSKPEEEETLLEHLVKTTDDFKLIKDETLNILIAGRDTTAATLTFAVYMLAQHPDILSRLREEIFTKLGAGANGRRPTHEDLRDMKYLRAVINETLRLYPVVPFNIRTATKDTLWPSKEPGEKPFFIPAGSSVIYSVFLMHRRTDLWGPDALEFDPDRFLDERLHKYLTRNPFIFLPFNAGPRICLGQQFAYNEASFFLVRLLQSFASITLTPEAQPSSHPPAQWAQLPGRASREKTWIKSHFTLFAAEGLWLKMEEASDDGGVEVLSA
ncbi:cytochrome P450 monooxygenase pc-3 [Stereum hirsutum FP-91666 SS1]|uniref:cytochrome P450 monooxygenase pc-3 n=1 Tax=Stereum hirsutum (strain FP-91666) TaxID=721885 RepID=UPI000444A4B1|nr:cytochrome P450 monooxygenase pc-3 [Stereum hirsutum FP-91666 SS1]EIM82729.1 cytochrome P450 monooxygenase pc-3 [Stereum hirsutum FP-91666 SS1]